MKLIFLINDSEGRYLDYTHTGILNSPARRSVVIELTPDQVEKIGIRKLGVNGVKNVMESIESVSICSE